MQFWNEMEGKTVAERFPLGKLLRSEGRSAWFTTSNEGKPAVIHITESLNDEDQLLGNLEAASQVRHSNVVTIERTGRARIDDSPVVYAILEPTEENLGEVLRDRALTPDETAQITESLVAGLAAFHQQGLLHGHVNPSNVLAHGDTVKLRSDCVQKVPAASRNTPETYAQDTGDLGATVFEALTRRKLTSPQDPAIDKLPAPFRAIVQSSVNGSWGLTEIAAALRKPSLNGTQQTNSAPPPPPPAAKGKTAAAPRPAVPPPAPPPARPVTPTPAAAASTAASAPPPAIAASSSGSRTSIRIFAIVAILAAIALGWYFLHRGSPADTTASTPPGDNPPAAASPSADNKPPAARPASPLTTPRSATRTSPGAAPATDVIPSAKRPALRNAAPGSAAAAAASSTGGTTIWRVVIYTYGRQQEAENKVADLNAHQPQLKPEVFSPSGRAPWLVTVGGPMNRHDAFELRTRVRNSGMPTDSYMQNFSH